MRLFKTMLYSRYTWHRHCVIVCMYTCMCGESKRASMRECLCVYLVITKVSLLYLADRKPLGCCCVCLVDVVVSDQTQLPSYFTKLFYKAIFIQTSVLVYI